MNTAPLTRMFRAMAPGSRGGSWRLVAGFAAACTVIQLIQPVLPAQAARVQAGAPAVSYTYDADGRLATVTNAAGDTATYNYDAVGDVTSITTTTASAQTRPASVRPVRAAIPRIASVLQPAVRTGQPVTITGSGFSTRRADDIVRIGSLFADVLSASPSRLTVAAPPGTGGKVTVSTTGGTSTHGTVAIAGSPRQPAVSKKGADPLPLRAAAGVTALAGQIDTAGGAPLAGVTVSVSGASSSTGASAVTNSKGQFLVTGLSAGRRTLVINGADLPGGHDYGTYSEPVELRPGRTSVMPWISYLTAIDTGAAVTLPSPTTQAVTLTSPRLPGLKVLIPAGTVIRNSKGTAVTSLSLTPLPTDRTPMPWGPGMVPQFFTLQPGDATISGPGLQVIYPNSSHRPAGETVDYVAENPAWDDSGWYRYGLGHVSANGKEIIPDSGTRYRTTGPGGYSTDGAPASGPPAGGNCQCGDPVDLATGLFDDQANDISLPDTEGLTLTRDFRQLDDVVRDFGIGGSDSLDLYIVVNDSGNFELVLPDGGTVQYTATSTTGLYQAVNTPTDYAGSTLTEDSDGDQDGPFVLALRNGTQLSFGNPAFLTGVTDRFGNTLTINRVEYNDASLGGGQIESVVTSDGRWLQFTYGVCVPSAGTECVTQVTDNDGRTVKYGYNSNGQLTSVTNVDGGVTKYAWAACTNVTTCTEVTSITDPMGRVTKISYTSAGLVSQQTEPNGGIWKYQYTTSSGVITKVVVTDPDGDESSTSIGSNGYVTSNTAGYGTSLAETTTTTYESGTGLVASVTDPLGRKTDYTYDALGNPLTVTALAGTSAAATTKYTYEPVYNRIASVTDPLGHTTTYSYNDAAGTETITDPMGRQTVITLNSLGQAVSTKDPLGGITYYSYLYGDLVATADPLGNVATTYYDSVGRPLEVTDADGNSSSYTYDPAGNKLTSTDALGNTTSFSYDADGELTSYTDASGNKTSYTYNSIGAVLTETDPLGKTASWTYDADGNVLTSTDRDGNVTDYNYDALGRLTTAKYGVTSSGDYDTVTTSYDQGNRPTQVTDSLTGTYSYSYDNLNDVTQYTSPQGSISYTYNSVGQRTGMTASGQSATGYTYDADGELTGLTQGSATASYSYDADGDLTSQTLPNGVTEADTYDAAANLTSTTDTNSSGSTVGSVQYTYDPDGRILTENGSLASTALPAAVESETYNADDELTTLNGTTSLTYDADGNLTSDGTNAYTWNPLGELSGVTTPSASYSYTYDPAGQRVSSTTGGTTTTSLYDGSALVQQSSGGSAVANYLSTGPGGTVQVQNSAGTSDPLTNTVGSTVAQTGSGGQLTTSYSYDPSGNTTTSGSANPDPEQYATSQADPTGLDQMGARYYSPALGRFISQDPLGLAGGSVNLYEYAGDDPVNFNDPTGTCGSVCGFLADVGAGALNGLTLGLFHIQPPYCGPGANFAFGLGNLLGGIALGVALGGIGGAILEAVGGALEAADWAGVAGDLIADETDTLTLEAEGAADEAGAEASLDSSAAEVDSGEGDLGSTADDADAAACGGESFTAGTKVLLASGVAIPISQINVGDKVLATNVKTGRTSAETVTAVMVRRDVDRYDLTIETGDRAAVIDTTRNHLFWNPVAGRWVKAGALKYGDNLRTPSGTTVTVIGGRAPAVVAGWMWDLSVPGGNDHDFYVDSAAAPVLVHNCPTGAEPSEIPQSAEDVLNYVQANGGEPPPGYVGGRTFGNYEGMLPSEDPAGNPITYQEYDVNPYQEGVNRGAERLVVGSDGSAYYTSNHYVSFAPIP